MGGGGVSEQGGIGHAQSFAQAGQEARAPAVARACSVNNIRDLIGGDVSFGPVPTAAERTLFIQFDHDVPAAAVLKKPRDV